MLKKPFRFFLFLWAYTLWSFLGLVFPASDSVCYISGQNIFLYPTDLFTERCLANLPTFLAGKGGGGAGVLHCRGTRL